MSNILTAKVLIEGTRPLWWHWFGPNAIPLEKQEKVGVAGNNPEEWRDTCLVTKDGQMYVEYTYIFACLRNAGMYTKRGRGNLKKFVGSTLQVLDNRILIDRFWPGFPNGSKFDLQETDPLPQDPSLPLYMDIRSVVNPSTKGRNIRYRIAASEGWKTEFNLKWDSTIISRGEMEAICIDAGSLCGLGSGRPIGMGRFDVVDFIINGS